MLPRFEQEVDSWLMAMLEPQVRLESMATSGPGATNLVTCIADAMMDSVPLVAVTGQVFQQFIGKSAFQETDFFGMTLPGS